MMSAKKHFLKIAPKDGERVRKTLIESNLLDLDYKIIAHDGALFIPLQQETQIERLEEIVGSIPFEAGVMEFEPLSQGPKNLTEALESLLSPDVIELVPRAYDLIGDIAVLEIPDELSKHKETIGRVFHQVHKNFVTVLAKKGAVT